MGTAEGNGLRIDVASDGASLVVRVAGELDIATAPQLGRYLENLQGVVVVDLSEVTFLDSTGLNMLVNARKRLHALGGQLALRDPHPAVRIVLAIARLEDWFD